jgi:hypothetical protein
MAQLGTPNYKVGLVIVRAQPFHNGHLRAVIDALMQCDEVIVSVRDYDTAFFDYNIAQKVFRKLLGKTSDRIAFYGTHADPLLGTPKLVIQRTLNKLQEANYHMPTHYYSYSDLWIDAARELPVIPVKIIKLADTDSDLIYQSVVDKTDYWKSRVPHAVIDEIETYIATKNRNF